MNIHSGGTVSMRARWYTTRAGGMHVHIADPTHHRLHRYRSLTTLTRADVGPGIAGNADKAVTTIMCEMVCRPDWAHAHSQCCSPIWYTTPLQAELSCALTTRQCNEDHERGSVTGHLGDNCVPVSTRLGRDFVCAALVGWATLGQRHYLTALFSGWCCPPTADNGCVVRPAE